MEMVSFHKIKNSLNQLIFVFGMHPRVRLTSDGYVKVKVPGRKSQLFKVYFLDSYRKRAFRNLIYVLEKLDFKIVGEEAVRRYVDLNFNGAPLKVQVKDSVLVTSLSPTPELVKKYPALTKQAYIYTFTYIGDGRFNTVFLYEEKEEYKALKEILEKIVYPLYMKALLYDMALKREENPEAANKRKERLTTRSEIENEETIQKDDEDHPKPQEKAKTHKQRRKRVKKRSESKRKAKKKREPSIEEVKERISIYQPEDFRSKLAYERYLEALKEAPEREEDIHRVFYNLIVRKKEFKDFYRQIYLLAPKLIAHFRTS